MVTRVSNTVSQLTPEEPFSQDKSFSGTPLQIRIRGGWTTDNDVWVLAPDTTVTLPDETVSKIVLEFTLGEISTNLQSSGNSHLLLYTVTTSGGVITSIVDERSAQSRKSVISTAPSGVPLSPYLKTSIDSGVVTWLPLDETTGRHLRDIGEGNADAILVGTESDYELGNDGMGALGFSSIKMKYNTGSADSGDLGILLPRRLYEDSSATAADDDNDFGAIGLWFYAHTATAPLATKTHLYGCNRENTTEANGMNLQITSGGELVFRVNSPVGGTHGERKTDAGNLFNGNTWYHVVVRQPTPASKWELWVNGVEQASSDVGANTNTSVWFNDWDMNDGTGKDVWSLGAHVYGYDSGTVSFTTGVNVFDMTAFDMSFSTFQIWLGDAPSDAQMLDLYNQGIT